MPRWPRAALAAALLGALLGGPVLAGCSTDGDDSPTPAARAVPTPDCLAPQVMAALGVDAGTPAFTRGPDAPATGALPEGFEPVGVLLCTADQRVTDGAGEWVAVTARRLEGDLDPLLRALQAGSTGPVGAGVADRDPAPGCAAPGAETDRLELWLVDATGAGVRPVLPVDECGTPPSEVRAALEPLAETDVNLFPVARADAPAG